MILELIYKDDQSNIMWNLLKQVAKRYSDRRNKEFTDDQLADIIRSIPPQILVNYMIEEMKSNNYKIVKDENTISSSSTDTNKL